MEHLGFKIEVEGLRIVDSQSRFEDSIMPHQHLTHMLLFVLCRESRYFEVIVQFSIFRFTTCSRSDLNRILRGYYEVQPQLKMGI